MLGWGWVVNVTPRPLYPRERYPVPIVQEAGWAPGPVWTDAENLAPPPGFDSRTVQPVVSRYTDWAIPARKCNTKAAINSTYSPFLAVVTSATSTRHSIYGGWPDAMENKFLKETPNICRSSAWNFLYVTLLAPKILRWFLYFWKSLCVLDIPRFHSSLALHTPCQFNTMRGHGSQIYFYIGSKIS